MVLVNGIEIPQAQSGVNMTATGWWQRDHARGRATAHSIRISRTRRGIRWAIRTAAWR